MRVLLAGIFVFVCLLVCIDLLGLISPEPPTWIGVPVILLVLFGSIFFSLVVFNKSRDKVRYKSAEQEARYLRDLEAQGLLIEEEFLAVRAFQVEEFEDEGAHYFLELDSGKVLFLTGQYLYDYEEPHRRFPNRHFIVCRHKEGGSVALLKCLGETLEIDQTVRPFDLEDYEKNVPKDGAVIEDATYDELLVRWAERAEA